MGETLAFSVNADLATEVSSIRSQSSVGSLYSIGEEMKAEDWDCASDANCPDYDSDGEASLFFKDPAMESVPDNRKQRRLVPMRFVTIAPQENCLAHYGHFASPKCYSDDCDTASGYTASLSTAPSWMSSSFASIGQATLSPRADGDEDDESSTCESLAYSVDHDLAYEELAPAEKRAQPPCFELPIVSAILRFVGRVSEPADPFVPQPSS